jgi:hypothetical protein
VALAWAWMRRFILFMFVNSLPSNSCFKSIVWHWHGHGWDGSSCLCLWTQFSHIHVSGHCVALTRAWMVHLVYVCELTSFIFMFQGIVWHWHRHGWDGSSCLCLWTHFLHIHVSGHCVALAWAWMRWFILFMFVNSLPSYSCFRALCGIGMGMDETVHPVYVCELNSLIFMFQGILWHWHGHEWDGLSCLCVCTHFLNIHVSGHCVALAWPWMRRLILSMFGNSLPSY